MRGHQPALDREGGGGSLGHTITDDSLCVPALGIIGDGSDDDA